MHAPVPGPAPTILYIGNIPYEWDQPTIAAVVCSTGKVVDVRVGFDYDGKNKGFGFVEFLTAQDALNAIPLLSNIKIMSGGPGGFQKYKTLRIDYSKEGLRSELDHKNVMTFDRSKIPPNVIFPSEMGNSVVPGLPSIPTTSFQPNIPAGLPPAPKPSTLPQQPSFLPPNPLQTFQQRQQHQIPQQQAPQQQLAQQAPPRILSPNPINSGSTDLMPSNLTGATQSLPQAQKLPFTTPDKISDTLSKIPPTQLIELIANLKNILNAPGASRAADVFQLSPNLAPSAAQALLLMGLIDSEVIAESMKSASSTPVPQQAPIQQSSGYGQQQGYQQQQQQGYQQQLPQIPQQPQHLPPPPSSQFNNNNNTTNNNNNYGSSNYNNAPSQPPQMQPLKWPHLPPQTQAKLLNLAPDQADLIAQVLSLPSDQISSLPPDKQSMVMNLRSQYM